jgi:FkbM family methyltransferase
MPIRSAISTVIYKTIAGGARLPRLKAVADYDQWGSLIDLTRRLRINVFLDVGANRGFYSKRLRDSGYRGHLFSFEPIASDVERIEGLAANDPLWQVCGCGLGSANGTKDFYLNDRDGETNMSSFLPYKGETKVKHPVPVLIRRLDDILPPLIKEIAAPRIFLKMDTQGFDGQVIDGAKGVMDRVVGLQSEVSVLPLYEGMPHYTDALALYEALSFSLMDLFVVNRTPDGRVVEYDCVMAKTVELSDCQ